MNTVKIGDAFEARTKTLIRKIIDNHELSINPAHCIVQEKVKYHSVKRKKEIIFDLSIEVRHPKANKPFLVCIIECKNLNKPVPVDDIEEFESKVDGIQEFQTKKIVIAKNGFQSGAFDTAKTLGITLIDVDEEGYTIVLYKPEKQFNIDTKQLEIEEELENAIRKALLPDKIEGLKKLSAKGINGIVVEFLKKIDSNITERYEKTPLDKVTAYLKEESSLKINDSNYLFDDSGSEQLGFYDVKKKAIYISPKVRNTVRFPFVLAHEIGHFILHSELKANQFTYDNFKDSEYSLFIQKNILVNDKNWIEWQANCFAASLLMPEETIIARLIDIQTKMGISKQGRIYLDNQSINKIDFRSIVEKLATFFGVSKISIEYRLESLGLIDRPALSDKDESGKEFLRTLSKISTF
ncbi:ImmA/IrrE family metallo-endopeptidase [Salegentibacter sp. Hel_I_6]|uniref:ImmA/IrrE family metallo-endopeptidase n=1 Tax=Salegentibacter sp. Hel_I_6 TaxID=1250278 RepID=UPI0005661C1B|nr:ImmA/IrrE family metallo-endopeptidase [Salegentibacter sp. Hel_I_6]